MSVARPFDAPEEVVRGEEHQVSAEVTVPLDEIVFTRGHVLVMPGEDDQVVRLGECCGALDLLEVPLREVVRLPARPLEPVEESEVIAKPVRHSAIEVGPAEPDGVHRLPAYQESALPSPSSSRKL